MYFWIHLSKDNYRCHCAAAERRPTALEKSRQSENTLIVGRGKKSKCVKFQTRYLSHPVALQG